MLFAFSETPKHGDFTLQEFFEKFSDSFFLTSKGKIC